MSLGVQYRIFRGVFNCSRSNSLIFKNLKNFDLSPRPTFLNFSTIRTSHNQAQNKSDHEDLNQQPNVNELFQNAQVKNVLLQRYLKEEKKFNGKLVYVGQLTWQLKSAKILSLSSSMLGIGLLPFLSETLSASSLFAKLFVFGSSAFFIFVTPIFSQLLTRRYVSRLYYNYEEKKFTAVLFNFFLFEYKLEFSIDDAYVPDLPGLFSTMKIKNKNRSLFVELNQMLDLSLTEKILGYDKPLDWDKYK